MRFSGAVVVVNERTALVVEPFVRMIAERAKLDGLLFGNALLEDWLSEHLEAAAAARRTRTSVPTEPSEPPACVGEFRTGTVTFVDAKTAADRLGISERAVTKRCNARTLTAEKVRGRWQIQMVEA